MHKLRSLIICSCICLFMACRNREAAQVEAGSSSGELAVAEVQAPTGPGPCNRSSTQQSPPADRGEQLDPPEVIPGSEAEVDDSLCGMDCENISACKPGSGNQSLRAVLTGGELDEVYANAVTGSDYILWASSTLRADGRPPLTELAFRKATPCKKNTYARWTCRYSPDKAKDGNPKTVWAEGVPGSGIGEVLLVRVNATRPIEIWAWARRFGSASRRQQPATQRTSVRTSGGGDGR